MNNNINYIVKLIIIRNKIIKIMNNNNNIMNNNIKYIIKLIIMLN
jgi:hypothetical protein